MLDEDSELARAAIFDIIRNQIDAETPPETKLTLERLVAEGHSEHEAMKLIGCVVASEIFGIMKESREYDETAYIEALQALPRLPWE